MYLNVQDNQRDISILDLLGYSQREIRRMMIQIYRPIVWTAFVITLIPGILTARTIQKALSAAIHDYMPFGVNFKGLL
ncbi:FtsX-like permease family protein [Extibacter muris]|uniref:FtsX-like permease family protein n=1 Tax=Extibacter muris TaxID=1796622 RepID=UPI0029056AD0|nr:FtsX-like permease family protein [Extibacter muris]